MSTTGYPNNPEISGNSTPEQLPVEETPPPQQVIPIHFPAQRPWVTYTLIGLTVFVFILQIASETAWGGGLCGLLGDENKPGDLSRAVLAFIYSHATAWQHYPYSV